MRVEFVIVLLDVLKNLMFAAVPAALLPPHPLPMLLQFGSLLPSASSPSRSTSVSSLSRSLSECLCTASGRAVPCCAVLCRAVGHVVRRPSPALHAPRLCTLSPPRSEGFPVSAGAALQRTYEVTPLLKDNRVSVHAVGSTGTRAHNNTC